MRSMVEGRSVGEAEDECRMAEAWTGHPSTTLRVVPLPPRLSPAGRQRIDPSAWQLTGEWAHDPDFLTEVEVVFRADGDHTIVEFEHRKLEAFERTARDGHVMGMDEGWGAILEGYRSEAERTD